MIKFGPSGNSLSFYEEGYKNTEEAALWVRNRGLDCFEYSFGQGVRLSADKALSIGEAFAAAGVEISVHAPYYVNLANPEEEAAEKSFGYILDSARMLKLMGGKRCVFHPASQGKMTREAAVEITLSRMRALAERIADAGLDDLLFCPETMGKKGQIGTAEEVAAFCKTAPFFLPTVDFGHINAREGGILKTQEDYESLLNGLIAALGMEKMKCFHVHFSKIQYGAKGEIRHLTFADTQYGPEFPPLAAALVRLGLTPYVVSESAGTQAEDAAEMKRIYEETIVSR